MDAQFVPFYIVCSNNILALFSEWGDCVRSVANMVHINIRASKSKPRCITVIHHMLESHHCPFGTAEAPCGFNRAKLQNPIQGHTKIPLSIQSSIHLRLHLVSLQSASVCWPYILSMQTVYCVFSPRFLNSGFWARGRLYTVSIGEKIKRSCSPSWKKSKLGVNWTAWAGAWDVMIRLLLASELLGLLCSHIDWTAPTPTGSLRSQEIRARPDPRLFILGLERSLTKGVGGSRWGTEASLFTRIQGSCCCRYCCSCLPVLQGGFLACQPWEASLTDGLENRVYPLLQRTRKKSTGAVRLSFQSCVEWTYFSFATLYT